MPVFAIVLWESPEWLVLLGIVLGWLLWLFRRAWQANRSTSLAHAIVWIALATLSWLAVLGDATRDQNTLQSYRYVALCLTGAAGVAVLGARRPYGGAWNFVVLGLLAVMLLPWIESLMLSRDLNDPLRIVFMGATIAVGLCNYLPTRWAVAALLAGVGCAGEMLELFAPGRFSNQWLSAARCALAMSPCAAWVCWLIPPARKDAFDVLWLDFRDRFGLFWGQRAREQFNLAARNAGWPVVLTWRGLRETEACTNMPAAAEGEMLHTLQAVLKRFMHADVPPKN
jgi:hypothetical protein